MMTFKTLKQFFVAPTFPEEERTRTAALLSILINIYTLAATSAGILMVVFTDVQVVFPVAALVLAISGLGLRILMRKGYVRLASFLLVSQVFLIMPLVAWSGGSSAMGVSMTVLQAVFIVMAGLLLGAPGAAFFVALIGLINGGLIYSDLHVNYVTETSRSPIETWFVQVISFGAIVTLLFVNNRTTQASFTRVKDREQRYRDILDNIPFISYLVEAEHPSRNSTLYVSPQVEKLTGYPAAELLNDPDFWINTIDPADRERVMAESERADLVGEPFDCEYRVIGKDNHTYWFQDRSVLVKDEHGKPLYRVGGWTDITIRKNAELALQQLEDMYRRAIKAAGAVPYVISHASGWSYLYIGDEILSLTGYTATELTAEIWDSLRLEAIPRGRLADLTFEDAGHLTDTDYSILWECDFHIRTRDGQKRWIADTSVKHRDEKSGQWVSIGIYQDITERKLAEDRIKNLNIELEQRVRERTSQLEAANKELEAFSYSVSHDLRAPLRAMISFSTILKEDYASVLDVDGQNYLQKVILAGKRMNQLIDDLLSFSRIGYKAMNMQDVDLPSLIQAVIENLALETANRQIEWILTETGSVTADPALLQQVYVNLIGNALKYTGKIPSARIEIGCLEQDGEKIHFVRDNGAGFDMKYAEKLFGVFQRLHSDSEFHGTGIGLATVQRIIHRHGGRIWAEAEPSKGATFYFTL